MAKGTHPSFSRLYIHNIETEYLQVFQSFSEAAKDAKAHLPKPDAYKLRARAEVWELHIPHRKSSLAEAMTLLANRNIRDLIIVYGAERTYIS